MGIIFFNLSPFKFSNILDNSKSPIKEIELLKFSHSSKQCYFEAHAWLKDHLKFENVESSNLYGSCDASGTDKYSNIAIWKCISESMERWAFYSLLRSNSKNFGMEYDKTTTGFSAFPCWPKSYVRSISYGEAIERWAISSWWREKISGQIFTDHINDDHGYALIDIGTIKGFVIISFKASKLKLQSDIFYSYGFAYGTTKEQALQKAQIEMLRNERVLSVNNDVEPKTICDQRLKYFSTQEGFEHFKFKFVKDFFRVNSFKSPQLIVDEEIPGPWSDFVTVWRCLLEDTDYCWNDPKHFMF